MIRAYLFNVLVALDQLLNTLTGGDPDETISSRTAKRRYQPGWRVLANILEYLDPGHLDRTLERDEGDQAIIK